MPLHKIKRLYNPSHYHGWNREKKFFEGWYYKIVNAAEDKAFAFIPGIAMDEKGKKHAFIQVLDGKKKTTVYHKFPANSFLPSKHQFELSIEKNHFTSDQISLALPQIHGHINFKNLVPWPSSLFSPGIMGPFSFVPFMECYHGILSMDHTITGVLQINGEEIDFTEGRGYIEKDWGHSFPSAYFWMQSNHFSTPGISVKASVAKIPWLTSSFVGFIAGVWLKNRLIQFTTYNFTKLKKSFADNEHVEIQLENRNYKLTIRAKRDAATELASPIGGMMDGRIEESMTSVLHVQLLDKKNNLFLLDDYGRNAGLEVAGKIDEIII